MKLIFFIILIAIKNDNLCSTNPNDFIFYQKGNIPILLTVPHGGLLKIDNINERTKGHKVMDHNTFDLTENINKKLNESGYYPYIVAARFDRKYIDANTPIKKSYEDEKAKDFYDSYHKQIFECIKEIKMLYGNQNPLLIDIHGQSKDKDMLFIGTQNKKTIKKLLMNCGVNALYGPDGILKTLLDSGLKIFPGTNDINQKEHNAYNGGFTVGNYGSHNETGIDAIQLEFDWNLRKIENLNETAKKLTLAIINFYKKYQRLIENQKNS